MLTVTRRAGRLAGIRFVSPITDEEMRGFEVDLRSVLAALPGQVVFCTDLRAARVLTDNVAERLIGVMRWDNLKVRRTALILPEGHAVLALQFERIVRAAGNPARRTFQHADQAAQWLAEVLGPAEQDSLLDFLAEGEMAPASRASVRSSARTYNTGPMSCVQGPTPRRLGSR
jgi:PAS domain-containing protein